MNEMFGLGILLNAKDQASASIFRVNSALEGLVDTLRQSGNVAETEMDKITTSMTKASDLIENGLKFSTMGKELIGLGSALVEPIKAVGQQIVSTGSQFEEWRMTLKALYKDADLAKEKLQWGLNLASTTPFEVGDVTQALIGFKAMGVEADSILTSVDGISQSMLEFIGDLAALRPDVGLQGVMMGVRNLMGGDGGKSLQMRLDLPLEEVLGRKFGKTQEQLMQDLADLSSKVANGLMKELEGTWNQMTSNLKDQSTRFFLAIGDAGAFDTLKKSLGRISEAIGSIDDNRMATIGKNIAEAFQLVLKPIDFVVEKLTNFAVKIIEVIESSPLLSKFIVGAITLLGTLAIASGALLVVAGGISIFAGAILYVKPILMGGMFALKNFAMSLVMLMPKIALVSGAMAVLYKAWKSDLGGVRTTLTNFMSNMQTAFKYSSEIASMGVNEMLNALATLDTTTFGGWLTYRLTQIKVFWIALVDAWNDYTLSEENFEKVRALGLLPLLETILDVKMRFEAFWEGFKKGWDNVVGFVVPLITKLCDVIGDVVAFLFPVKDGMDEVNMSTEKADFSKWTELGEDLAYIVSILGGLFVVSKIVGFITAVASAISGIVSGIVGFVSGIGGFVTSVVSVISGALSAIGGLAIGIAGAFGLAITAPAWLVGAIVLLVAGAVALIIRHWDKVKEGIGTVCSAIVGIVTGTIVAIIGVIMSIITVVMMVGGAILSIIGGIVGGVMTVVYAIVGIFAVGFELIKGIVSTAITIVGTILGGILAVVMSIVSYIVGFFQTGFAVIQAVVETFCAIAKAIFTGDFTALSETLKGIWNGLGDKIKSIWSNVTNFVSSIWDTIGGLISKAWDSLGEKWNTIMDNIKSIADKSVQAVKDVWSGIGDFFSTIWDGIMSSASGMFSWLADKFSWVTSAINGVKNFFSGGSKSVSSAPSSAGNMVGLNTGGYVKTEGVAMLHPNEVVVNDELTQKLRGYLDEKESSQPSNGVSNILVQNSDNKMTPDLITPSNVDNSNEVVNNNISNSKEQLFNSVSNVNNTNSRSYDKSSSNQQVDNSITFSEGSIQITMTDGKDADIDKLVKKIAEKLKRETSLRNTLNYTPSFR